MFWHVPFQELQVSKRNRHFEQNFQLSQHLFPVPFFSLRSGCPWRIVLLRLWRLWASLLECGHPWDAWHIQTTSTSNIQTPNKNITHCEVKLLPCRVSKQRVQLLWQKSWYFYHRKHRNMSSGWSFPDQFTAVSKTSMKLPQWISDRQKPRNGMIQFQKWLVQRWITWWSQLSHILEPSPCLVGPSYHQASTWVGSPFDLVNSKFWWVKTRSLTAAPSFLLVVSFCIHYVPIWWFYCCYLLIV